MASTTPSAPAVAGAMRIVVFLDYWNFQLTLNEREAAAQGSPDTRFRIDWQKIGPWLAQKAAGVVGATSHTFEGLHIYTSYGPGPEGAKFRKWATTWLDRQSGVHVECRERKPRSTLKCTTCYQGITHCPHCTNAITSTVEKGVDTLVATDMIRLAWENAYDVAVLASSDSDLVPAVEFLALRGRKIVQAGFPPKGVDLATSCWGSFDVFKGRYDIQFNPPKK